MYNLNDMPIGLRMALTRNLDALNKFSSLDAAKQNSFIQGAHNVRSKQGMEAYVNNLMQG